MRQTKAKFQPSDEVIFQQLERICSSNELRTKKRICQLLRYLVKESIAGRSDQLKGYTIGLEVFSRDKDFNPELDPIVRIQAGRLRRSLDNYYLNEGKNDSIRFSIPKGNYIPTFLPQEASQLQSIEQQEKPEERSFTSSTNPSIAVLPFINLTGNPEREFFVQGFAEELSIELTRYEDFHVIGYRIPSGHKHDIYNDKKEIQRLGAHFVIDGSVRKDEHQVKISIKLIDTYTCEHLWAEQFKLDLTPANLIAIQEEIARESVTTIASEYGIIFQKLSKESRKKAPKELNTYEAMLAFYYYNSVLSSESFLNALTSLQLAIEREPDCVPALAMLADLYFSCYTLDLPGIENPLEKGAELIKKAIDLDPGNQLTQIIYAYLHFLRGDKPSFINTIENAIQLNPSSIFRLGAIGFLLCLYGEWERGKSFLDDVMNLNPTFPNWYYGPLTCYYYRTKDYKLANEEALKFNMENNFWGPMLRAACLGQLKRKDESTQDLNDLLNLRPDFRDRGKYLISRYVKEEELVDHIVEGLKKAGLKIR